MTSGSDAVRDFVTGDVLPSGTPHHFDKFGLGHQSGDVGLSNLCSSLSSQGHFLYFLTPPLRWARQRRIQRIEIMYSCGVVGGKLQEEQLIDVAVVREQSSAAPVVGACQRLRAIRRDWRNCASIDVGNSLIDDIRRGNRVGLWVNVMDGANVSMFHALVKIFFSS
jgi:hypothetical protein